MNIKTPIAIAALTCGAVSAFAQQDQNAPSIGVAVGIFRPSSSELKNDVGSQFLSFGIGGTTTGLPSQGSITPSYSLIFANGNGNKLFILPLTFGYEYEFGSDLSAQYLPYVRPFVGAAYYDYSITDFASGVHSSTKQLGGTYGLEAGILISHKIKLTATYNYFTQTNGFSFNGLTLSASVSLFTL